MSIQASLKLKKGVLANNTILNKEEFMQFFNSQISMDKKRSILNRLTRIKNLFLAKKIKEGYLAWERFEQDIFNNDNYTVSLLFIENINSSTGKDYSFKYASKETKVMSDRGKLTKISQLNKKLFAEELENSIFDHLFEFIQDIEQKEYKDNITYQQYFYGNNPAWYGQAGDAFMNHLAQYHAQIFAGQVDNVDLPLFTTRVFNEQKKDNLVKLLQDSKNHTPWSTGGDIILFFRGERYNIQLKSSMPQNGSTRKTRKIGQIKTTALISLIDDLYLHFSTDWQKAGEILYSHLETSGWIDFTEQAIGNIATDLIESGFSKV